MPLGPGVRYRWKTTKSGKKIRLAFRGNRVIEVKPEGGKAKRVDRKTRSRKRRKRK